MKPYLDESIYTKYKSLVEANKERRKARGSWSEDEPEEIIWDTQLDGATDEEGNPVHYPWDMQNLLSIFWVQDLFGDDYMVVHTLLRVHPYDLVMINTEHYENVEYVRESSLVIIIQLLTTLAKSNFVNNLRPLPINVQGVSAPVYSSQDIMSILDIKETTLRKLRNDGWLTYRQVEGSDKIWYTQEDLDAFLNHPKIAHKAWK